VKGDEVDHKTVPDPVDRVAESAGYSESETDSQPDVLLGDPRQGPTDHGYCDQSSSKEERQPESAGPVRPETPGSASVFSVLKRENVGDQNQPVRPGQLTFDHEFRREIERQPAGDENSQAFLVLHIHLPRQRSMQHGSRVPHSRYRRAGSGSRSGSGFGFWDSGSVSGSVSLPDTSCGWKAINLGCCPTDTFDPVAEWRYSALALARA